MSSVNLLIRLSPKTQSKKGNATVPKSPSKSDTATVEKSKQILRSFIEDNLSRLCNNPQLSNVAFVLSQTNKNQTHAHVDDSPLKKQPSPSLSSATEHGLGDEPLYYAVKSLFAVQSPAFANILFPKDPSQSLKSSLLHKPPVPQPKPQSQSKELQGLDEESNENCPTIVLNHITPSGLR